MVWLKCRVIRHQWRTDEEEEADVNVADSFHDVGAHVHQVGRWPKPDGWQAGNTEQGRVWCHGEGRQWCESVVVVFCPSYVQPATRQSSCLVDLRVQILANEWRLTDHCPSTPFTTAPWYCDVQQISIINVWYFLSNYLPFMSLEDHFVWYVVVLCCTHQSGSCTLCSEKKHPLTFSFISPWVMCRFKQKLQWIYLRNGGFWQFRN